MIPNLVRKFFEPAFPRSAVSISAENVAAIRVGAQVPLSLIGSAVVPLPAGAVVPSHTKPNLVDRQSVERALVQAVEKTGLFRKEVNLLIPDFAARVFVINLEVIPSKGADLVQLLRFKVKKSVAFPVEEAALAYQVQTLSPSQHEVILTILSREILEEYESVARAAGLEPGFVTVEHFGVAQLMDRMARDWKSKSTLLFRMAPNTMTSSIYHRGFLRFYRAVEKDRPSSQQPSLSAEALFEEVYPSLAYFQDKYEHPIEVIYFSGLPADGERLCAGVQKLSECRALEIRADKAVAAGASSVGPAQINGVFAPLIGMELGMA